MDPTIHSGLLLRLCECKDGEVVESPVYQRSSPTVGTLHQVPLGNAVMAKWDPTHPNRIGVLYSSGTLRLWDVVTDSRRDFALYIPSAGIPSDASENPNIPDRRLPTPITHFDFLPLHTNMSYKPGMPQIAFTVRRSRHLHIARLPSQDSRPRPQTTDNHYVNGSRVFQCASELPAECSSLCCWLVCPKPVAIAAVCVGGVDGSLSSWVMSGSFNPDTIVSMRSDRYASPAFIKADNSSPGCAVQAFELGLQPAHVSASAHAGRIKQMRPLVFTMWDDDDDDSYTSATRSSTGVKTGLAAFAAAAKNVVGNTMFATSGDDGSVRIWQLSISVSKQQSPTSFLLSGASDNSGDDICVKLIRSMQIPCDGVRVTSLVSVRWPLALNASAFGALAAGYQLQYGHKAPGLHHRTLLATGNLEGAISLWEIISPRFLLDVVQSSPTTADNLPNVRLIGIVSGHSNEPISDIGLAEPLEVAGPYSLVSADVDGVLRTYTIDCNSAMSDELPTSHGSSGPVIITAVSEVQTGEECASVHDVIQSISPQASALHTMGQFGHGDDDSKSTSVSDTTGIQNPQLTTALTALAIQRLRSCIIAGAFNTYSRLHRCDQADPAYEAYMACNGAGDVMLWQRTSLPGIIPMDLPVEPEADIYPGTPTAQTDRQDWSRHEACDEVLPAPQPSVEPIIQATLDAPAVSLPPSAGGHELEPMDADLAAASQALPTDHEGLDEMNNQAHGPMRLSRVLQDTESRRSYQQALQDTYADMHRARSQSPLGGRAHAYLRQAAADAVRSAYLAQPSPDASLGMAQHFRTGARRSKSPVDRLVMRASRDVALRYGIEESDITSTGAMRCGDLPGDGMSMKNPAKVAAALVKDARENARAAILSIDEDAGHAHPDAVATYERISERSSDYHHHLVAPTVGSSSAITRALDQLQAMEFDWAGAIDDILAEKNITDRTIRLEVLKRYHGTDAAQENEPPLVDVEDDLAYSPSYHKASTRTVVPAQAAPPSQRLFKPTASSQQKAADKSDRVSVSDVLAWHGGLRSGLPASSSPSNFAKKARLQTRPGNTEMRNVPAPWETGRKATDTSHPLEREGAA